MKRVLEQIVNAVAEDHVIDDALEWPEHIQMVHCGSSQDARYERLTNIIAELTG